MSSLLQVLVFTALHDDDDEEDGNPLRSFSISDHGESHAA